MSANSVLDRVGLFFDENHTLRVLEPELNSATGELTVQCAQFIDYSSNFQDIVEDFVQVVDKLANEVEAQKIRALGTRNQLKSVAKERENERQQLQGLVVEKRLELERLRTQFASIQRLENEQADLIENLNSRKN